MADEIAKLAPEEMVSLPLKFMFNQAQLSLKNVIIFYLQS